MPTGNAFRKWSVRIALAAALGLAAGTAVAIAFLGTQSGRDAVARLVEGALSDEQSTVRIVRVTGNLASAFEIGEISLADAAGNVVIVEGARLSWHPFALIGGTLDIERLEIDRISVAGFTDAGPDQPSGSAAPPPVAIRVAALTVKEIALDEAVLGAPQRLSLAGSLSADASLPGIVVKARLARLDAAPGHADVDLAYTARPAHFAARIDIEEPAGGPIARLAGLPGTTPLSVKLDGAGPPDAWRGRLSATASPLATLASDLTVSVTDSGASLTFDGDASVGRLLPDAVASLAAPRARFHAVIDYASAGTVALREFAATTDALSVRATGRYGVARGTVGATLTVAAGDGLGLPGLATGMKIDGARIDARIDGTIAAPVLAVQFAARRLSGPGVVAAGLAGKLSLKAGPDRQVAVSGDGRVNGLDTGGAIPAGLIGQGLDIDFDGLLRADGTAPSLGLKIASGAMTATMDAAMATPGILEGRYALRHGNFGPFAAGLGLAVGGAADAKGDFRADLARGEAHIGVAGALSDITSTESWLAGLLGRRTSVSGAVAWNADDTLRIAGLELISGHARLQGNGTIRPAAGVLDARYAIALADLSRLSSVAGTPLSGRLEASGTVTGMLAAPHVAAQVATRGLTVAGIAIGDIGAGMAVRPTAAGLRAAVRLGGAVDGRSLAGDLDVTADGATVRLTRLRLTVGRNSLDGALVIDTGRLRLTGEATAALSHLEDVPGFATLPGIASGSGTIRVRLRATDIQELLVDATAQKLVLDDRTTGPVSVGGLTASVSIRNPFADYSVDGKVRLTGIAAQGAMLNTATLTAKGDRRSLGWSASADGTWHVPVAVTGAGTLTLAPDVTSLLIRRLDGKVATHAIHLREPARLAWSPRSVNAGPVDLAVSGGRLRFSAEGKGAALDVTGEIEAVPIALAALADSRLDLAGTLSGKLRLTGVAPVPSIDLALSAMGVRPVDLSQEAFEGLSIDASLRQDAADARLTLNMRGPDETTARASLRMAPLVGLGPLRLLDVSGQRLAGQVDARARLAVIDRILSLGEDRLAGNLDATVRIAGTPAQPVMNGMASLSGGAYEGAATGVVIRDAAARVEFSGNRARLVSFAATDGGSGRISGEGAFDLGGRAADAGRLSVKLTRFVAIRRPEAQLVASGTIAVRGPLKAPAIEGKLTVDNGELRIPDRLPEEVVELPVEEINEPAGGAAVSSRRAEPSVSRSLPVALDVAVDFPGKTFVRGRGLDSEWKGALSVGGTSAKPKIAGKLNVVRGTFAFAGKTFVLKSGGVELSGPDQAEPEIDATAEARLKTLLARVRISGRLSRPTLSVTSEPPLPQEEVLAHILFGRTTGQLSAIQAAQLAQTAATLSGNGSSANVVDRVRQALGVDVLNVETSEGTGTGASLKAGKYVTEDVFLSVTQGTEPGSQKVGVEVEVLPNLSVESDVSGKSSGNVGVNWKFDY